MNFEEKIIERLKRIEREVERLRVKERPAGGSGVTDHGALTGLSDNDHPQYLLTTGTAADSDKLDGLDSTAFAAAGHDHDTNYLGITAKAADSAKLGGVNASDLLSGWIPSPGLNFGDPSADPLAGFCLVSGGVVYNVFAVGDKIKFTQDGITKYAYVVSLHSDWLLRIYGGSDYTFTSNTVTNAYYSHATSPLGFPQWFNWTPTLTVSGGTAPTYATFINRYCQVGKLVVVTGQWSNSTGGTAGAGASEILVTLPVAPKATADVYTGSAGYGNGGVYAIGAITIFASMSKFSITKSGWFYLTGAEQNNAVRDVFFTFEYEAA